MATNGDGVPGTWLLTVTVPGIGVVRTIMTFTDDGGVVDRAQPNLEAGVGVWERGDTDAQFRYMIYRFTHDLTVTEPSKKAEEAEKGEQEEIEVVEVTFARTLRVRTTNHFTGPDTFEGHGTADILNSAMTGPTGPPVFLATHRGVRLKLVPE